MWNIALVRRFELPFIVGVATIYVIRRLVQEVTRIDNMVGIIRSIPGPASLRLPDLGTYNYILNNNIPLITGAVFFLMAWYIFHYRTYPELSQNSANRQEWLLGGLVIVLLFFSALSYHYQKIHLRFQHDDFGQIIGIKAFSLYRKRTVVADTIGLGIILLSYELVAQFYYFLNQKITQDTQTYFRPISYLFIIGVSLFFVAFALTAQLPPTLWDYQLRGMLITLALIIQVYFLQAYCFTYVLPHIRRELLAVSVANLIVYVVLGLLGSIILCWVSGPYTFSRLISFLALTYLTSFSIAYLRQTLNRETTVLQTQVSTKSAELASLRAQINPHFLFNALNSLYATALRENSEKTADGIQKLGDMMRFMLQENNRDRIPMSKEIEYLHNYIQLQRMRLDESHAIEIRVNIQEPDRDIYLAPMMLIPFVENAFKHGISLRNPSWIYITLTLDATRLYFKVHNSLHTKPTNDTEKEHSGVGLDNVRKRLALIYPDRHELSIQQSDQDYFVSLTLVFW
ncbi:histidine kinase [Spirosoma sp. SC4-14]|uniref:sensor histidine kinase n=1 Tax=Spirosoma sp. SC4-14 TaxID=3128900 RepID=UPI0030D5DDAC